MEKSGKIIILTSLILLLMASFAPVISQAQAEDENINVQVSIYPIYEIADRIGGERIEVEQFIPQGVEIHGYEPSPRRMAALEDTDAFIYVGAGLEPWAERAVESLDTETTALLQLADKIELRPYEEDHDHDEHEDAHDHGHDEEGEDAHDNNDHDDHDHENGEAHEDAHGHNDNESHDHDENSDNGHDHHHGEYDTHIWLDFNLMQRVASEISQLFIELDPAGEEIYRENAAQVQEKLQELDNNYREGLAERKKNTIIVSHAAFGYLTDNYGLEQRAVTGLSPHDEPSPGTVSELIDIARERNLEYIFMEVLASPQVVEVIAEEAGLEILTLDPAAGLTEEQIEQGEDYFSIMYSNLDNLKQALKK